LSKNVLDQEKRDFGNSLFTGWRNQGTKTPLKANKRLNFGNSFVIETSCISCQTNFL